MTKIETLYLIDDDTTFHFLSNEIIKSTQLVNQIQFFSNGFDAIKFLKSVYDAPEKLPDVIFLDLFMPVMDGWRFLEEFIILKPSLNKKIKIYIVSSSIDPVDYERAKSISEVTDFIIKPVTKSKFIDVMNNIVI